MTVICLQRGVLFVTKTTTKMTVTKVRKQTASTTENLKVEILT